MLRQHKCVVNGMVGCLCGSLVVWRTLSGSSVQNTTPHVSVWDPSGCALNTSTRREPFCGSLKKVWEQYYLRCRLWADSCGASLCLEKKIAQWNF